MLTYHSVWHCLIGHALSVFEFSITVLVQCLDPFLRFHHSLQIHWRMRPRLAKFFPQEAFDFSRPVGWPDWKWCFSCYKITTKLNAEVEEILVCSLIYAFGPQAAAEQIFNPFAIPADGDRDKYDLALGNCDDCFVSKQNLIHKQPCFHQRNQKPGESAEAYIQWLQKNNNRRLWIWWLQKWND